jgi:hypothetical protein
MNPQKKVTIHQLAEEQQQAISAQQAQQQSGHDFSSVEEMLRHDALHTPVPPAIAHRLQESVSQLPPPARRGWWRRIFGGPRL